MLDLALNGALMVAAGGLGSLLMWVLIGRKIITKYGADAWIARLKEPDPEMQAAIDALVSQILNEKLMTSAWNWFLTAEIPTGKSETAEDGTTKPIMTTPYQNLIQATTTAIFLKLKAMRGGLQTQGNAALAGALGGEDAPLLASLGPRKGQSTAEWVVEQVAMKALAPGGVLDRKIKALVGDVSSSGAEGW